tara:strand:- start:132 stop:302 length:171 start_codon:yes stop_codon:yes gene_type:complete
MLFVEFTEKVLHMARIIKGRVKYFFADVAQLAEQLICNQQVVGSNPSVGSFKKYVG